MRQRIVWRFCLTIACFSFASQTFAASDTWTSNLSDNWSVSSDWVIGTPYATGADATANFSVLNGSTVTDDLPSNTIGYLVFGSNAATLTPAVSTNTLTLQTTVANTTPSITVSSGGAATIGAILAGNQGLVKFGAGAAILTGSNTLSGAVTITAGTLSLTTSSGALAGVTGYTIQSGGVFLLSNSAAANNTDRVSDSATITMKSGTFNFFNDAVASTGYSETVGTLQVASAENGITTATANATGGTSSLTFNSLARSMGTVLNFTNATNLGSARNGVFFTTAPTLDAGNLIGGWALVGGSDFATYSGSSGVAATTYTTHTEPNWVAGDNVSMTASTTASSSHTINALKLPTRNTALTLSSSLGNFLLTVQDGGILETATGASAQQVNITGGSLTAGTAGIGGEMVIASTLFAAGNVYRFGVSSAIVDNAGGPVSLTIGAANNASGRTALFSTGDSYSGDTTVAGGILNIGNGAGQVIPFGAGKGNVNVYTSLEMAGNNQQINGLNGNGLITNTKWDGGLGGSAVTLTLGNNNANGTFSGSIQGSSGRTIALAKVGSGLEILSGSGYVLTGNAAISGGTLQIGDGSNATATIGANTIADSGALSFNYNGPVTVTNPVTGPGTVNQISTAPLTLSGVSSFSGGLNIYGSTVVAGGTSSAVLGSGAVSFANSTTLDLNGNNRNVGLLRTLGNGSGVTITSNAAGTPLLTISGSSSATYAGTIGNGSATTLGITKLGVGTQGFTGVNTYTGATTVSNGTLAVSGNGSLANTAITVNSGGMFSLQPGSGTISLGNTATVGVGATLTLSAGTGANAGGGFSMVDGSIGTVNLVQEGTFGGPALTLGGAGAAANQPQLAFELGPSGTSDQLSISTGMVSVGATSAAIALTPLPGLTSLATGTYTVITAPGGLGSSFSLATPTLVVGTHTYNVDLLSSNSTAEVVNLSVGAPLNAYWGGAQNASWSSNASGATNWLGGPAGTDTQQLPGPATNVFLTSNSATNTATTLDGSFTINSLSFTGSGTTAGSGSVSIAGGSGGTLTINAANSFSDANSTNYVVGTGLVVQPGSAAQLIGPDVNFNLGASQKWLMNSVNPLTVAGTIGDNGNGYSLTVSGSGTLILTGSNIYAGATTVNTATLQLGSGGTSGSVAGPITDNNSLLLNRSDDYVLGNTISGSGNLTQIGSDNVTLSATNSFTGQTVVSSGTLTTGSNLALQSSTLNYNSQGGMLSFGTLTAATLGGLTGSQGLVLLNTSSAPVTLTVGNNGVSTTCSGDLSGAGANLVDVNGGTFTLTGSNEYSGFTAVNAGTLVVAPSGVVNTTTANVASGATLLVAGGTLTSSNQTTIGSHNVFGGTFSISSGVASFSGGLTTNNADGGLIIVTGGSFSASSIILPRTSNPGAPNAVGIPPAIPTTSGFYVSGGTANIGTLTISTLNSSATARIDGGVVNATGEILIGDEATNTRWNYLQVNGGALTSSDTTNGIVIGQCGAGGTETIQSELYLTGGTTTAQRIAFGAPTDLVGGTANLAINGGVLYLPSGALVLDNSFGLTTNIYLAAGTFGVMSDFETGFNMQLTGNTTAGITIQTADASGTPHNITLDGAISGSGAMTVTGGGVLTLTNVNPYSGATVVTAGTLDISAGSTGVGKVGNDMVIAPLSTNVATVIVGSGATLTDARTVVGGNQANTSGGMATLALSGGTINSSQWFTVGSQQGQGTFNMQGGLVTVNSLGGAHFEVAVFGTASGTVNQADGDVQLFNNANIQMGGFPGQNDAAGLDSGSGVYNQNGGTITFYSDAGFTLGGTGHLALGEGLSRTGTYTYNLNGGTLTVPSIVSFSGTSVFNFNGGLLVAPASTTTFMQGLTAANVEAGGALINADNNEITIAQSLLRSGGTAADGGLTLTGGTLELSGANTYNGLTYDESGALILASPTAIEEGNSLIVGDTNGALILASPAAMAATTAFGQSPSTTISPVPEPSTGVLLLLGLIGGGVWFRLGRRKTTQPGRCEGT